MKARAAIFGAHLSAPDRGSDSSRARQHLQNFDHAIIHADLAATSGLRSFMCASKFAMIKLGRSGKDSDDSGQRIGMRLLCLDGTAQSQAERSWMANGIHILERVPCHPTLPRPVLNEVLGADVLRSATGLSLARAFPHFFARLRTTTKEIMCTAVQYPGIPLRKLLQKLLSDRGLIKVCYSIVEAVWNLLQNGVVCTDVSTATIQWNRTHQQAVLTQLGRAITVGPVFPGQPSLDQLSLTREQDATSTADSIPCSDVRQYLMGEDESVAVDRFPPESREAMGAVVDGSARLGGILAHQLGTVIFELATGTPFAAALQQVESGADKTRAVCEGITVPELVALQLDRRPAAMQQLVRGLLDRRPSSRLKVSDAVQKLQQMSKDCLGANNLPGAGLRSGKARGPGRPRAVGSVQFQDSCLAVPETDENSFISGGFFSADGTEDGSQLHRRRQDRPPSDTVGTQPWRIGPMSGAGGDFTHAAGAPLQSGHIGTPDTTSAGDSPKLLRFGDNAIMPPAASPEELGTLASTHGSLRWTQAARNRPPVPSMDLRSVYRDDSDASHSVLGQDACASTASPREARQSVDTAGWHSPLARVHARRLTSVSQVSQDFPAGMSPIVTVGQGPTSEGDSFGACEEGVAVAFVNHTQTSRANVDADSSTNEEVQELVRPRAQAFAADDGSEMAAALEHSLQSIGIMACQHCAPLRRMQQRHMTNCVAVPNITSVGVSWSDQAECEPCTFDVSSMTEAGRGPAGAEKPEPGLHEAGTGQKGRQATLLTRVPPHLMKRLPRRRQQMMVPYRLPWQQDGDTLRGTRAGSSQDHLTEGAHLAHISKQSAETHRCDLARPHSIDEGLEYEQNGSSAALAVGSCDVELNREPQANPSREGCSRVAPTERGKVAPAIQPYPNALVDEASAVPVEQAAGHTDSAPALSNRNHVGSNDVSWPQSLPDIDDGMGGRTSIQRNEQGEDSGLLVGFEASSWPARQIDAESEGYTFSWTHRQVNPDVSDETSSQSSGQQTESACSGECCNNSAVWYYGQTSALTQSEQGLGAVGQAFNAYGGYKSSSLSQARRGLPSHRSGDSIRRVDLSPPSPKNRSPGQSLVHRDFSQSSIQCMQDSGCAGMYATLSAATNTAADALRDSEWQEAERAMGTRWAQAQFSSDVPRHIRVALAESDQAWHVSSATFELPAASSASVGVEGPWCAGQASVPEADTIGIPSIGAAARSRQPQVEAASGAGHGWGHHVDTDGSGPTETQTIRKELLQLHQRILAMRSTSSDDPGQARYQDLGEWGESTLAAVPEQADDDRRGTPDPSPEEEECDSPSQAVAGTDCNKDDRPRTQSIMDRCTVS